MPEGKKVMFSLMFLDKNYSSRTNNNALSVLSASNMIG